MKAALYRVLMAGVGCFVLAAATPMAVAAGSEAAAASAEAPAASPEAPISGPEGASMDEGRTLFMSGATPACAVCHTLDDAGASGTIGPNLDELKPAAAQVEKAIREGIGIMPAFDTLSDEQVRALARYVNVASGGQ